MTSDLETATNTDGLERIVIEPLTRVEGHGKVTLLQDEDNNIQQARLHISEFRGFEKFIQGHPLPTPYTGTFLSWSEACSQQ